MLKTNKSTVELCNENGKKIGKGSRLTNRVVPTSIALDAALTVACIACLKRGIRLNDLLSVYAKVLVSEAL